MTSHMLIAGGGYVGVYTAFRLRRAVRKGEVLGSLHHPSDEFRRAASA